MHRTAAASIAAAARWEAPSPDTAGVITFRLNEGLRLEVFSPDGQTVILRGTVCPLPADEADADALAEKALRLAAAGGRRRSILSLSPPESPESPGAQKLLLHRAVRQGDARTIGTDIFAHGAQGLLNDLTWWRKQLVESDQTLFTPPDLYASFFLHNPGGPLR